MYTCQIYITFLKKKLKGVEGQIIMYKCIYVSGCRKNAEAVGGSVMLYVQYARVDVIAVFMPSSYK
jgi:hypothetical protein